MQRKMSQTETGSIIEIKTRTVVDLKMISHAIGYNIVTSITTLADVSLKRDLGNSASLPTK